jgi:hypothetical protein
MIPEVIVGAVTAVSLGCIWLAERVVHHVFEPPAEEKVGEMEGVWPFQTSEGACRLCGQTTDDLRVQAQGDQYLIFSCQVCGGAFKTGVCTHPSGAVRKHA